MSEKFIGMLLKWIRTLKLDEYSDEYNNWCFGNKKQKHICHLHPYNENVDIEINSPKKFQDVLIKFKNKIRAHEWHPDKWLVVNLKTEEDFRIAKNIISDLI